MNMQINLPKEVEKRGREHCFQINLLVFFYQLATYLLYTLTVGMVENIAL